MGTVKKAASYSDHKSDLLARLRRIEGQVRGVQRMVEEDTYCIEILNQISAVVSASEKVGLKVIEDHIRGCVLDAVGSKDRSAKVEELTTVLEKFLQTRHSVVAKR